jgi:hypothetical protein
MGREAAFQGRVRDRGPWLQCARAGQGWWIACWLALAGWVVQAAESPAAPTDTTSEFLRFEVLGKGEGRVQTATRSYVNESGARVDLVAAVHIADRAYFGALQDKFEAYDAVLYEMVRDRELKPGEKINTDNPLSQLQITMKSVLGLEFQLDSLDYARPNFVHADLDPDTFFRLQQQKGESILGLLIRAVFEEQARQSANPSAVVEPFQLLAALLSADRAHALKLLLGRQMGQLEQVVAGIDRGSDGQGSVLVSERNRHALRILEEQLGKGRRRVGIFYGAGHMSDFKRRLLTAGFRETGVEWLTAWDIRRTRRAAPPSSP